MVIARHVVSTNSQIHPDAFVSQNVSSMSTKIILVYVDLAVLERSQIKLDATVYRFKFQTVRVIKSLHHKIHATPAHTHQSQMT